MKAFLGDASDFMVDMARNGERVDVLFMDPPRKGSDEKFLNARLKLLPDRIVYISCDPSSLARDLVSLKGKYEIEVIQPFDMFPMTTHPLSGNMFLRRSLLKTISGLFML